MKKKKLQFKINDRVVVTDSGECFTDYTQMFDKLDFKNCDSNPGFEEGTSARIFNICQHPHSDCWLIALVDDEGNECLSSNLGITLIKTDTSISVNDLVRITNPGKTYSTHKEMFAQMGFKDEYENSAWNTGEIGRVFDISTRDYDNKTVYAVVHADGRECLISRLGIELVQQPSVDSATIDRMSARLSKIESKLDQYAQFIASQNKPKTAVEWLIDELTAYDFGMDNENHYEICLSIEELAEIKATALQMEKQQNCK